MSCAPTGRPESAPTPTGTLTPQLPAMLSEMVNMSDRYICVGLEISPNLNAVRGLAGMRMASTFAKASR